MSFRQSVKLIFIFILSILFYYILYIFLNNFLSSVIVEMLDIFYVIVIFSSAFSIAQFNYVDNITKDIASNNNKSDSRYKKAIDGLDMLRKEILYNLFLILILFLLERIFRSIMIALHNSDYYILILVMAVRFAFFILSIFAIFSQLKGFITASDYRTIMSR